MSSRVRDEALLLRPRATIVATVVVVQDEEGVHAFGDVNTDVVLSTEHWRTRSACLDGFAQRWNEHLAGSRLGAGDE